MRQKNKGQTESERLQNKFTSYLSMILQYRRVEYLQQVIERYQTEQLTDYLAADLEFYVEQEIIETLPLLMRLENDTLLCALKKLTERERQVLLARVLDEKGFGELAEQLGMTYKGVAAVYYRALKKLKNYMREVEHGF